MTLPEQITTREYEKFEDVDGLVHVRTKSTGVFSPSGLRNGGKVTLVFLSDISWTPLPASPLSNRNAISIQNESGVLVKLNYDAGVSGFVGASVFPGGERFYGITDNIILYAKSEPGFTCQVTVEELS